MAKWFRRVVAKIKIRFMMADINREFRRVERQLGRS